MKDIFKEIRKCLDDCEEAVEKYEYNPTKEYEDILQYSELHLAEAIMKNKFYDSSKIARFIMAEKGFEIKI